MAKISELRKPDPTNLIIITILAFISGIGVNYLALQSSSIPGTDLPFLSKQSVSNVLKLLNISSSSSSSKGIQHSIPYQLSKVLGKNEGARFFWIIVTFFRAMLTRPLGKGLLMLLLTFSAPMLLAVSLETFRPKRSKWLSASMVILFTSVGQAICIGAATNLIYIPAYALARWRESTKEPIVRPTASPSASLVSIALTCSTLAGLTIFWTCLTPTDSDWWVLSNLAFQFFPLCYIPLLFIPTPSKQSTSREPRLAAARAYQLLSYLSIPAYYVSLYVAWPQIQPALSKAGANPFKFFKFLFSDLNDGEHLLLWDGLGLLVAAYAMVLIEAEADEAYVRNGGKPVHARRFLHEDIAVGWVGILLFGPGFGLATFFGRREMMAEKARWGVTSKSE